MTRRLESPSILPHVLAQSQLSVDSEDQAAALHLSKVWVRDRNVTVVCLVQHPVTTTCNRDLTPHSRSAAVTRASLSPLAGWQQRRSRRTRSQMTMLSCTKDSS